MHGAMTSKAVPRVEFLLVSAFDSADAVMGDGQCSVLLLAVG